MPEERGWGQYAHVEALVSERADAPDNDSRLVDINRRWSECMAARGYRYPGPYELMASVRSGPNTSGIPTADELSAAKADHECKKSTDYMTTAIAVQTAYELCFIDKHRARLDQLRPTIDKFLREHG